jgi:hypothetical protein
MRSFHVAVLIARAWSDVTAKTSVWKSALRSLREFRSCQLLERESRRAALAHDLVIGPAERMQKRRR